MSLIRTVNDTEGTLFVRVDDLVTMLRESGQRYLEHIPAHVAAGEFIEAAMDKHADFILGEVADFLEAGPPA